MIGREELQRALIEQLGEGKGRLLGEIMVALGLIEEETLLVALRRQASGEVGMA